MQKDGVFDPKARCEIREWDYIFSSVRTSFNGDLFRRVVPFTLLRLCLFLIISQTLRRFFRPLKQTGYVCDLLTGILLGPSVLGTYKSYAAIKDSGSYQHFQNITGLPGALYCVFVIAVKTSTGLMFRTCRKKVWAIGLFFFIAPFLITGIMSFVLCPQVFQVPYHAFMLAMQLSSTSFINLAPTLEELNLLTTTLGHLSLPLSITNECVIWGSWVLVILAHSFVQHDFFKSIFPLGVTVAVTICVLSPAMEWIVRRMPDRRRAKKIYFVAMLLGAGVMAGLCDAIAGAPVLGVAFFGLIIPNGPPLGSMITEKSEFFIKNCYLPFFYLALGDVTNVYEMKNNWKVHLIYQLIIFVGCLTKTLVTTFPAMVTYNMSPKQGLALGLVLNTSGVVNCIVIWSFWLRQKMETSLASQLILSSLVVTALVCPLTFHFHKHHRKSDIKSIQGYELSKHASSRNSELRILACLDDKDDVPGIITVIKACNPTDEQSPIFVFIVHLTELLGQATPTLTLHKEHNRICQHNGCVDIMRTLNRLSNDPEGPLVWQLLTMTAQFKDMPEGICWLAQQKWTPVIIVPFVYKSPDQPRQQATSSELNRKIQTQTPGTVGIFIDKGMGNKQEEYQDCFSYQVAVIFFGGEDDREAITFAARMSEHPGVSITVLRVIVQVFCNLQDEKDKLWDEYLVDLARKMIIRNGNGAFHEVHAKNWLQAMQVVQSLNGNYDLVLAGRRHGETAEQEEELSVLSANPELGHIGEMLASSEFHQGTISVLVMQHYVEFEPLEGLTLSLDDTFLDNLN